MKNLPAGLPRQDLLGIELRADEVVVLDQTVMVIYRDAVADRIEDGLQFVSLVTQLDLGLFALGDVLSRAVEPDNPSGTVDRRLDDRINPPCGAVAEQQAMFDLIALTMFDALAEVLYDAVAVLRMDPAGEIFLGCFLAAEAHDAQQFIRGLHRAGVGVETPGAHVGH